MSVKPKRDKRYNCARVYIFQHIASVVQVTGFVPQDDILLPLLTVEESLLFSARRRLPASYTSDQHVRHVEDALQVLTLSNNVLNIVQLDPLSGASNSFQL